MLRKPILAEWEKEWLKQMGEYVWKNPHASSKPERNTALVNDFFDGKLSITEIAKKYGITPGRAKEIIKQMIRRLDRAHILTSCFEDFTEAQALGTFRIFGHLRKHGLFFERLKMIMKNLFAALILCLLGVGAKADSVWDYQGNVMTGCNCALNGTVVLPDAPGPGPFAAPVSWDFTDGLHELTQTNSTAFIVTSFFNGAPLFSTWSVILVGDAGWNLKTQFYGSGFEAVDISWLENGLGPDFGYLQGHRGAWVDPIDTPEPRAIDTLALVLMLVSAGMIGARALPKGMKAR